MLAVQFTTFLLIFLVGTCSTNHAVLLGNLREPTIQLYGLTQAVNPPDFPVIIMLLYMVLALSFSTKTVFKWIIVGAAFTTITKANTNTLFEMWGLYPKINTGLDNALAATHPPILILSALVYGTLSFLRSCPGLYWALRKPTATSLYHPLYPAILSLVLSSWWANQELFWGSYWNWDPVETSALLAIVLALAYEHYFPGIKNTLTASLMSKMACGIPIVVYFFNKTPLAQSVHSFNQGPIGMLGNTTSLIVSAAIFYWLLQTCLRAIKTPIKYTILYTWRLLCTALFAPLALHTCVTLVEGAEVSILHPRFVNYVWVMAVYAILVYWFFTPITRRTHYPTYPMPLNHLKLLILLPLLFMWPTLTEAMVAERVWPGMLRTCTLFVSEYRHQINLPNGPTTLIYSNHPHTGGVKFKHTIFQPTNHRYSNWTANYFYKPGNRTHFVLLKDCF